MSQEIHKDDEEIDFGKFFEKFIIFLKGLLKLVFLAIQFYSKKRFLFIGIAVVGAISGYFLDKKLKASDENMQEIVIEPKYGTKKFIYNFIENLQDNLADEEFRKEMNLDIDLTKNLIKIEMEPIVRYRDILSEKSLTSKTSNPDIHRIIENLQSDKLEGEKYREFFKYDKISVYFNSENKENEKITQAVLEYLKTNEYFKKELQLAMDHSKREVVQNKKSLDFINEFLDNVAKNSDSSPESTVVIGGENEIPTVASLLRQKELLMEKILEAERDITLNNQVFSIVKYGNIISTKKPLKKRLFVTIPMFLLGIVSGLYFLRFLFKRIYLFAQSNE